MYIYPDNLKSKAVLWLWELRDIAIIGVGALISVFAMAQLGFLPPVVITAAFSSRFLLAMMNGFLSGSVALCCCMGSQPAPETNQKSEERSSTNESQTSM